MRIAITADVHLTSRDKHPQRFHALENILDQLIEENINTLIIAGDLFDATCKNPGEMEEIICNKKYENILIYIIPGNHDPVISKGTFVLPNIKYIVEPEKIDLDGKHSFFFLPYNPDKTMGEVISDLDFTPPQSDWCLVAHGDFLSGMQIPNAYERGLYMPLSRRDLELFKPRKVFLGHIHVANENSVVNYPGSPCGIDHTETGKRTFLICDTNNWTIEKRVITTDVIYINETLTIIPSSDEETYIRNQITEKISHWALDESQKAKIKLKVTVLGYSTNRDSLVKTINSAFEQFHYYDDQQPDVRHVKISVDTTRAQIAESVQQQIKVLPRKNNPDEPTNDEIIIAALQTIYGGK